MSKKELELLAPAGNLEILKKVVDAGCDAVYFGGSMFGARAYADNFSLSDASEGIRYAHLFNAKAFLTVNTLIKNIEFEKLYSYIKDYRDAGIDAVLVQDFSVLRFIRDNFPDLDVHASTQMSVTSTNGVSFLQEQGVKRVVLARELSLNEISDIYKNTNAELEAFVHGAICVCYSGQCLLSSMLGGRSGNRGRCAQPCRLPYELYENKKKITDAGKYILSPKDMCLINRIPELAAAGVYSFKIEGRMKSEEYASGVVSIYRKYIDKYLSSDKNYNVSKSDIELLMGLGNRSGFTNVYLDRNNGPELMSMEDSSLHTNSDLKLLPVDRKIEISVKVVIKKDTPLTICLTDISDKNNLFFNNKLKKIDFSKVIISKCCPEIAKKMPLSAKDIEKQLRKTGDTIFKVKEINSEIDDDIFVPVGLLNSYRREFISKLENCILKANDNLNIYVKPDENADNATLSNVNGSPHESEPYTSYSDFKYFFSISNIEQFYEVIKNADRNTAIILDHSFLDMKPDTLNEILLDIKKAGATSVLKLPPVLRKKAFDYLEKYKSLLNNFDLYTASSYDYLGYLDSLGVSRENVILDHRLYTFNNAAITDFRTLGYRRFNAPFELNKAELQHRDNNGSIITVYGRTELMIKADCTRKNIKGCDKCSAVLNLKDRKGKFFPVRNDCSICMNTIYNSVPLNLIDEIDQIKRMGFSGARFDFSIESGEEVSEIMKMYQTSKKHLNQDNKKIHGEYTKGHFNRGVE
jgi:putative protease